MKSISLGPTVGGRICQRLYDLHLLNDRAWPSMRHYYGQSVLMFRTDVNEVNVEPIDLSDEVRHSFQFRFPFAPVIITAPVACEFLHRRELHALRCIADCFHLRPFSRVYPSA